VTDGTMVTTEANVATDALAGVLPGLDTSLGGLQASTDIPFVSDLAAGTLGSPLGGDLPDATAAVAGTVDSASDLAGPLLEPMDIVDVPLGDVANLPATVGPAYELLADIPALADGAAPLSAVSDLLPVLSDPSTPSPAGGMLADLHSQVANLLGTPDGSPADVPVSSVPGVGEPHGPGPSFDAPPPISDHGAVSSATDASAFAHADDASELVRVADYWQPPVDVGGDSPAFFAPPAGTVETFDPGTTLTEILGTGYVTWKLAIFAAVLASITRVYANATGCLNSVQLVTFSNVQLIRCGIVSPIMRLATASTAAVSDAMSASGTASSRIRTNRQFEAVAHNLRRVADVQSTVVKRALDGDGALMMRLAKLLGLVYAGFLAFWLWATRLRWNGR
jgi:hypothetical protein